MGSGPAALDKHAAPWVIIQFGGRAEDRFCAKVPRTGNQSRAAHDPDLKEHMHLYALNRGIFMTPFHNMALMCPATSLADVDRHTGVFADAVEELLGKPPRAG